MMDWLHKHRKYSLPIFYTVVGLCLGGLFFGHTAPEPEVQVRTVVKHKTETKTVTKSVLPDACDKALDIMRQLQEPMAEVYDLAGPQLKVLSDARQAILLGNLEDLVKVADDQTAIDGKSSGPAYKLISLHDDYMAAVDACDVAIGE